MSKLIYAKSKAGFNIAFDTAAKLAAIDKSIAILEDGYFWTHGNFFKLFKDSEDLLKVSKTDNIVKITDSSGGTISFNTGITSISGTSPIIATTSKGVTSLSHKTGKEGTFGANATSASVKVPVIEFDAFGHLIEGASTTATLNRVLTNTDTSGTVHYITGSAGTSSSTSNLVKSTKISFKPNTGDLTASILRANTVYEGSKKLSDLYAPLAHVDVKATGGTLGHVTLSDSTESTSGASGGIAATPAAVKAAMDYAKGIIVAGDAMIFKGLVGANGALTGEGGTGNIKTVTGYKAGWTYKVTVSQTVLGETVEPGDMLIAINDEVGGHKDSDWSVIQANIDGAVTAVDTLTANRLLFGDGNRGAKSLSSGSSGQYLISKGTGLPKWESRTFNTLTVTGGSASGVFSAQSASNALSGLTFTNGLTGSLSSKTLTVGHSNSTSAQTSQAVRSFTYDSHGHITGSSVVTSLPTKENLSFYYGTSSSKTFNGGNPLGIKFANGTDISMSGALSGDIITYTLGLTHRYRKVAVNGTEILGNTSTGILDISADDKAQNVLTARWHGNKVKLFAPDTWRAVDVYNQATASYASLGTTKLQFGSEFNWHNEELKLGWAEVSDNGSITYTV